VVATILQNATYGSVELGPEEADRAIRAGRRARRAILNGALATPPLSGVANLTAMPPSRVTSDARGLGNVDEGCR
jgi:hypothetical protein